MPTEPAPVVVEASGNFLGNDGAWSTFLIKVGNPRKQLSVLASTEIPETWVVFPSGCVLSDPANCTDTRGGTYNVSASNTWNEKKLYTLGTEGNLGYTQNSDVGDYGFDTLEVGVPGRGNVSLDHQLIAGLATKDFYLGNLGLADRTLVFDGGEPETGLMSQLKSQNKIPSLSYGYTAGASYHQINASLTLGGYDTSRFTPNNVTFTFATNPLRSKMVALQLIVATDSNSETTLLNQPVVALVDSTVPHLWLPDEVCQDFEKAFGLTYDALSDLYLVNDTIHDALIKRNARISFQLSNSLSGGPAVNITLPYDSFDLNVTSSFFKNGSRYFPLRRALSESQYTLGRTFFQESYLMVNYESKNFSISQSLFPKDSSSRIVAFQPVETQTATSSPTASPTSTGSSALPPVTTSTSHPSHSLGTPAIAGIAIAIVLLLVIAGGIGVWRLRMKRKRERKRESKPQPDEPELAAYPIAPRDRAELSGGEFPGSSNGKKGPRTSVEEVSDEKIQTQMDQQEIGLMDHQGNSRNEMSGSEVLTPELPTPDPFAVHELSSPEAELMRSELSTPEPASVEMPSPNIGGTAVGERSPPLGDVPSPLSSPDSVYSNNRTLSRRPVHGSIDSSASESEGGWTGGGAAPASARHTTLTAEPSEMRRQPGGDHNRVPSSASSRQRPRSGRADSSDSEITLPSATIKTVRTTQTHVRIDSSDSETFPPPQRRPSMPLSRPPHHGRLNSKDSVETMETRLEQSSPPDSPFFGQRPARDRPTEGVPSLGLQSSQETLVSPTATSMRSGLRSPEPWLREEDEDEAINPDSRRR